jgi:phosphatidylinositol-3-phosphatase
MASRMTLRLFWIAVAVVLVGACGNSTPTPSPGPPSPVAPTAGPSTSPSPSSSASPSPSPTLVPTPIPTPAPLEGIPNFKHVYLIVMENKEYVRIVGSKFAPYENGLMARYGLATSMYAESHPSEPNYIAMTSGGLQGVVGDGYFNLSAPSIFDQIEAAGHTWHVYAQNYPGKCYTGSVATGGVDGWGYAGEYARKHNPAISYTSISRNKTRCANITHLSGFDPAAADFEMIVPNLINDMHSSSVAAGDTFLKAFVPKIIGSPAFAGSVLFITWDEGGSYVHGGGHIATIVVSATMAPASRYTTLCSHYALMRTIEDAWRMPYLGTATKAAPLAFPY